jgi:hypothetical protein
MEKKPVEESQGANPPARGRRKVIVQKAAYRREPPLRKRAWKISQYLPLVKLRLVRNGTQAVALLNLSHLPADASPEACVAWGRSFRRAIEAGQELEQAVQSADQSIQAGEESGDD